MGTTTKNNTLEQKKIRKKEEEVFMDTENIIMLLDYSLSIWFPVFSQFQKDQVVSDELSMLVEAVVLPWDLFLSGKNSTKVSKDQNKEPVELYDRNYHECGSHKRCKIDHPWVRPWSSGVRDKSTIPGMGSCGYLSDSSNANEQDPAEIPCLACFRGDSLVSSGKLYSTEATLNFCAGCKPSALKVLLEFRSESLFKYQVSFFSFH